MSRRRSPSAAHARRSKELTRSLFLRQPFHIRGFRAVDRRFVSRGIDERIRNVSLAWLPFIVELILGSMGGQEDVAFQFLLLPERPRIIVGYLRIFLISNQYGAGINAVHICD